MNRPDPQGAGNPGSRLHWPTIAIVASTFAWGTWWIPLRKLDSLGNGSVWFTGMGFLLPALIFLPYMVRHARRIISAGWPLLICAIAFGISSSFYAEGTMRGNVSRVILLFYLTPVWSTLLARLILGEAITRRRMFTIVLGLTGMWIILGKGGSFPVPQDVAEWLGLLAGIGWAVAMVYTQLTKHLSMFDIAGPVFVCMALSFLGLTLIPGGRTWTNETSLLLPQAVLWIVAIAALWHLPAILLSLFGGAVLEPGRVAILLMLEVVIGVGSSALWAGEIFGFRELAGATFVMAASVCEFVRLPDRK